MLQTSNGGQKEGKQPVNLFFTPKFLKDVNIDRFFIDYQVGAPSITY